MNNINFKNNIKQQMNKEKDILKNSESLISFLKSSIDNIVQEDIFSKPQTLSEFEIIKNEYFNLSKIEEEQQLNIIDSEKEQDKEIKKEIKETTNIEINEQNMLNKAELDKMLNLFDDQKKTTINNILNKLFLCLKAYLVDNDSIFFDVIIKQYNELVAELGDNNLTFKLFSPNTKSLINDFKKIKEEGNDKKFIQFKLLFKKIENISELSEEANKINKIFILFKDNKNILSKLNRVNNFSQNSSVDYELDSFFNDIYLNNNTNIEKLLVDFTNHRINSTTNKICIYSVVASSGVGKTRFCIEAKKALLKKVNNGESNIYPLFVSYNNKTSIHNQECHFDINTLCCIFGIRMLFDLLFSNSFLNPYNDLYNFIELIKFIFDDNLEFLTTKHIKEFLSFQTKNKINELAVFVDETVQFKSKFDESKVINLIESIHKINSCYEVRICYTSLENFEKFNDFVKIQNETKTRSERVVKWYLLNNIMDYMKYFHKFYENNENHFTLIQSKYILCFTGGHAKSIGYVLNSFQEKSKIKAIEMIIRSLSTEINILHNKQEELEKVYKALVGRLFSNNFKLNLLLRELFFKGFLIGNLIGVGEEVYIAHCTIPLLKLYYLSSKISFNMFNKFIEQIFIYSIIEVKMANTSYAFEKINTYIFALYIEGNFYNQIYTEDNCKSICLISKEQGLYQSHNEKELFIKIKSILPIKENKIVNKDEMGIFLIGGNNQGYDSLIKDLYSDIYIEFKTYNSIKKKNIDRKEVLNDISHKISLISPNRERNNAFIYFTFRTIAYKKKELKTKIIHKGVTFDIYIIDRENFRKTLINSSLGMLFDLLEEMIINNK